MCIEAQEAHELPRLFVTHNLFAHFGFWPHYQYSGRCKNAQLSCQLLFSVDSAVDPVHWQITPHIDCDHIELAFDLLAIGPISEVILKQMGAVGAIIQMKENEQLLSTGLCILNIHGNFKKGLFKPAWQFVMHGFWFNAAGKTL